MNNPDRPVFTSKRVILLNRVVLLNLFLLAVLSAIFLSQFSSLGEGGLFLLYFGLLLLGGLGFSLLFGKFTDRPVVHLIVSLFLGIIINYFFFIFLHFLHFLHFPGGHISLSPFLLAALGLVLLIFNAGKVKEIFRRPELLNDRWLFLLLLLMVFSLFLFSDKMTFTEEGIYVHDPRHPTTELSFAQSLETMFPVEYLSYQGIEFKYHFGYGILAYQLANDFKIDPLRLVYLLFPGLMVIVLLFLLDEFSRKFAGQKKSVLFCAIVLFSTLSFPIQTIIELVNRFFGLSLSAPSNPFFIFAQLIKMGSFALAIVMVVLLLLLIEREKRHYFLETVLLTGLAMTKITFFIVCALAYFTFSLFRLAQNRQLKEFIVRNLMLVPGTAYFLIFVTGAHAHNLWIIFPGSLNIDSLTLNSSRLLSNAFLSLLSALFFFVGIGIFYLWPAFKELKGRFLQKARENSPTLLVLLIIFFSCLLGLGLVEVTESNHKQFLMPGYVLLTLVSWRLIFTRFFSREPGKSLKPDKVLSKKPGKKLNKIIAVFLLCLVLVNFFFLVFFYAFPTYKLPYDYEKSGNSPLALLKIGLVHSFKNPGSQLPLAVDCRYSYDLIEAMKILAEQPRGIFLFNALHQSCENYPTSTWEEIVLSKNGGFIRTAVSGQPTLVESYKFKGVLIEEDYCPRLYENLLFYWLVTGKEDDFKKLEIVFSPSAIPGYQEFSYYPYFRLFSRENFYTHNQKFTECITERIRESRAENLGVPFLKDYLQRNALSYLLFERGEKPLPYFVKELGLVPLYLSQGVELYKVELSRPEDPLDSFVKSLFSQFI